jgi:purine nucleoside permease
MEELRADEANEFVNIMTDGESWFCRSYESNSMFATLTSISDQVTFEDLQRVFLNWMERLSWAIEHDGAYFQE